MQLNGSESWAGTCRQPGVAAVCARSPPSGPLKGRGIGGVISWTDTTPPQEYPGQKIALTALSPEPLCHLCIDRLSSSESICKLIQLSIGSQTPPPSQRPISCHWGNTELDTGSLGYHRLPQFSVMLTLLEDTVHVEPVGCTGLIVAATLHVRAQSPGSRITHHSRRRRTDPV